MAIFLLVILFLLNFNSSKQQQQQECIETTKIYKNLINIEYTFKYDLFDYGYLKDNLEIGAILAILRINNNNYENKISIETITTTESNLFNLVKLLKNIYLIKRNSNEIQFNKI